MRLIDDEGRLFGRINVFDLVVLALILLLIPLVPMWVRESPNPLETHWRKSGYKVVRVLFRNLPPEVASLLKPGDKERNSNGFVNGEILSIAENAPEEKGTIDLDGKPYTVYSDKERSVVARLRILAYEFEDRIVCDKTMDPLKVGAKYSFSTPQYYVTGNIVKVDGAKE